MRPYGTQKQLEKRRRRAIELLKSGMKPSAVAKKLSCSKNSVYEWKKQFEQEGAKGLNSKEVPGRPTKLNERQQKKLVEILMNGALQNGYPSELWTTRRVAEVIKKRFGVAYHANHVWRVLVGLGLSCQKPEKQARQRNEEEIRHWKRYSLPHIKKRYSP